MTNTTTPQPYPVDHPIWRYAQAMRIIAERHGDRIKVFVQYDGTLRVVASSVSLAKITMNRVEHATDLRLADIIDTFQVRFTGSELYATYQVTHDPSDPQYQPGTGMLMDRSSPELVYPWRYQCPDCGQQPRHHTRACPNRRR
jgi:hypothetical protein